MTKVTSLTELEQQAKPLMDYLKTLKNPHVCAIVSIDDVEVFEGLAKTFDNEYRKSKKEKK